MNVKLLRKVAKHILAEPKRLYMERLCFRAPAGAVVDLEGFTRKMPSCGTAACIAGWTCILNDAEIDRNPAQNLLEISREAGSALFFVWAWPDKFKKRWLAAKDLETRARVVAGRHGRIEHFIKTGE